MRYFSILVASFIMSISSLLAQQSSDTLTVGIKEAPPFVIFEEDGSYSGLSIWLWERLADANGSTYKYEEFDLDELLVALEKQEIDLSVNPLTVTAERAREMSFTQPFYITSLAIAVNSNESMHLFSFLRRFFSWRFFSAVGLLLLLLLGIGVMAWLFERKENGSQFGGKGLNGLWQGLWWSAVTMTTVGYGDKAPMTTGGRTVALIWMFASIIIISGFTASIASALTVNELETSISGPEDLREAKNLTVTSSTGESYLDGMQVRHDTYDDLEQTLVILNQGKADALVYDEALLKYTLKENQRFDNVSILPAKFDTQYYSFAFSKGHPLLDEVNPLLLLVIKSNDWNAQLGYYGLDKY